jgi:23S rRNA pseudouridine1911/1915/1917 synthase
MRPEVLYEDNHLLVAVKPPNVPSQKDASGDMDMLSMMKAYIKRQYNKPGDVFLGLVHRLDRPAGGAMVFARTGKAAARLSEQLRKKELRRGYYAVVRGRPKERDTLTDYLLKDTSQNKVAVVPEGTAGAKRAVLHYALLETNNDLSLVQVILETGRPHQIRVQMAGENLPLYGDMRYGGEVPGRQLALWSGALELVHPTKKETMIFYSHPPNKRPWQDFELARANLALNKIFGGAF